MEITLVDFLKWARQRTQTTGNEMLYPHNPDIADSEEVEVISWSDFSALIYQLAEGRIVIVKDEHSDEDKFSIKKEGN